MATYREGWEDAARYCAALISSTSWDVETRKRLHALVDMLLDVAPDVPPPSDAKWRTRKPPKEPPAP